MSGFGIQDLIVALLALSALGYLLRRRRSRRSQGCENCPHLKAGNPASAAAQPGPRLLTIEPRSPRPKP